MFSRLARPIKSNSILTRRLLPSLLSSNKLLNRQQVRFDSIAAENYEFFKNHMNDAHIKAKKVSNEGIVGRYGWINFWGMVGVICLSKELVVVNAEFMVLGSFLAFTVGLYISAGEVVQDMITQLLADNKTMFDKVSNWKIEHMRVHKAKTQVEIETVPVLEEMLKQQREVEKSYLIAQNLEQRHALRQAIIDKLTQIKVREDAEAALELAALIDKAVANVYKSFLEDDGTLREEALINAISLMGTDGSTKLEDDPVKKLFAKEFQ